MNGGYEVADVWRARGRGFSMAKVAPRGRLVHLTGQVAWDAGEAIVCPGDVEGQTRRCFENIRRLLLPVGGRLDDLVDTTTWLLAAEDLPAVQRVRDDLRLVDPPCSTSVVVAALGHPDFLVEITAVAVVPPERFKEPQPDAAGPFA